MLKRVLIITYYWPPSGGAGVQRWLKFVKYLPQFGWQPVVYTPENPEYPVLDHSLEKDIPGTTEVIKTRVWEPYEAYKRMIGLKKGDRINAAFLSESEKPKRAESLAVWIRGNFFIPDARKFWIRPSVRFLTDYLKKNPVDVVVSTGPPHSMHLIARQLNKKLNIPWLADFRDPWTGIDFYQDLKLSHSADKKHHRLEKQVLQSADEVVVISEGMKKHFNEIINRDYKVITNGFDEDDIPDRPVETDEKFSIAHIGTLARSRNPVNLWKSLQELIRENKDFSRHLEIKLVGKVDFHVMESLKQHGLENHLKLIPYLPHDKVLEEQRRSRVLLLLINNTPNAKMILTGKMFEYMSARRPILCIGPENGDAARIIRKTQSGEIAGFADDNLIRKHLESFYRNYLSENNDQAKQDISSYSREALTGKLNVNLTGLVSVPR